MYVCGKEYVGPNTHSKFSPIVVVCGVVETRTLSPTLMSRVGEFVWRCVFCFDTNMRTSFTSVVGRLADWSFLFGLLSFAVMEDITTLDGSLVLF